MHNPRTPPTHRPASHRLRDSERDLSRKSTPSTHARTHTHTPRSPTRLPHRAGKASGPARAQNSRVSAPASPPPQPTARRGDGDRRLPAPARDRPVDVVRSRPATRHRAPRRLADGQIPQPPAPRSSLTTPPIPQAPAARRCRSRPQHKVQMVGGGKRASCVTTLRCDGRSCTATLAAGPAT